MIRINLLAGERAKAHEDAATFQIGQKLTLGCSLILVARGAVHRLAVLDAQQRVGASSTREIAAAQQETTRLQSIIQQVQQFEQRKAQLQQRVALIEQLRKGQTGPVHMLDQISRALPPMLWLTEMKQDRRATSSIDGRCTTLTALSDFVGEPRGVRLLQAVGRDRRAARSSRPPPAGELIRFTIKAQFQMPGDAQRRRRSAPSRAA